MILYHGGAPGFRPGDVIEPHPTKHVDGCEWCASGADDNHAPDRVFASVHRLYAKYYASRFVRGSLYIVDPVGVMLPSEADPFESYSAPAFSVVVVSERSVQLTRAERLRLQRQWKADDLARGKPALDPLSERHLLHLLEATT